MESIFVHHRLYGRGYIVAQSEKTLCVRFEREEIGEKSFLWPDAFERHLRYEDSDRQKEMDIRLTETHRAEAVASAAREESRLRMILEAKQRKKALAAARRKAVRKNMEQSKKSGFSL